MKRFSVEMKVVVHVDADTAEEAGSAAIDKLLTEYRECFTNEEIVQEGYIRDVKAEELLF